MFLTGIIVISFGFFDNVIFKKKKFVGMNPNLYCVYIYIISKFYLFIIIILLLSHINSYVIISFLLINQIILFLFFLYLSFNASTILISASMTPMALCLSPNFIFHFSCATIYFTNKNLSHISLFH